MNKSLYVSKTKFLYICISIIAVLFSYLCIADNQYTALAVSTVVELAAFLIIMRKINGTIIDFSIVYVLILFIFHFGQLILLGLFEQQTRRHQMRIVLDYIPTSECVNALRLMNIAFVAICFGILFKAKKSIEYAEFDDNKKLCNDFKHYHNQAAVIIAFTFPIKVIIDVLFLAIAYSQGFIAGKTWYSAFPDIPKTIGNFSLIGFGLLLVTLKNNPKKQRLLMLGIVGYYLILMSSGRRSENVAYLCMFIFLYLQSNSKKLSLKKTLIWIVLGYFLMGFLYNIVELRNSADKSVASFFNSLIDNILNNNIMMQALREYGNTGYTAVCVICYWLTRFSPSYGTSYFLGISAVFPNIGGIMGELSTKSAFALQLQNEHAITSSYTNIGGSFIGELFFNFGCIGGIIAAFIAGLMIGFVCVKIKEHMESERYDKLIYYIPIMTGVLYWVRDSFQGSIREIVWGILFCYVINMIYNIRRLN